MRQVPFSGTCVITLPALPPPEKSHYVTTIGAAIWRAALVTEPGLTRILTIGLALICLIAASAIAGVYTRGWLSGDDVQIAAASSQVIETPLSNSEAKQDRLAVATPSHEPPVADAGLRSGLDDELVAEPPIDVPMLPMARPKIVDHADVHYSLLSESQIKALKGRLKLTSAQERHWPAIETALRSVARKVHDARQSNQSDALDAADIEQLHVAAKPLLAQLREDQKREVRQLARVIGLSAVAARI